VLSLIGQIFYKQDGLSIQMGDPDPGFIIVGCFVSVVGLAALVRNLLAKSDPMLGGFLQLVAGIILISGLAVTTKSQADKAIVYILCFLCFLYLIGGILTLVGA
jgi:hypothetical protein